MAEEKPAADDEVCALLERVRSGMATDGPAVIATAVIAFVDDERKTNPSERCLCPEETAKVHQLIHRYRDWFEAYWHERGVRGLADEAESYQEGSPERDELYNLLGNFLASSESK